MVSLGHNTSGPKLSFSVLQYEIDLNSALWILFPIAAANEIINKTVNRKQRNLIREGNKQNVSVSGYI